MYIDIIFGFLISAIASLIIFDKYLQKYPILPIIWSFIFVVLTLMLFPHSYYVNDDVGIYFNIQANVPIVFFSALLGAGISKLYSIISFIPWYGIVLYALHTVCISIIIKCLLKLKKPKFIKFFYYQYIFPRTPYS
jgi:hypothetical protein